MYKLQNKEKQAKNKDKNFDAVVVQVDIINKNDMFDFSKMNCKSIKNRLTKKIGKTLNKINRKYTRKYMNFINSITNINS